MEIGIREAIDNLYIIATNEDGKKARDIEGYYEKCFDRVIEEIDKLQEENEELKETKEKVIEIIIEPSEDTETMFIRLVNLFKIPKREDKATYIEKNYISKDKIRDKIKELEDKKWELSDEQGFWCSSELLYQIDILQELLEEE